MSKQLPSKRASLTALKNDIAAADLAALFVEVEAAITQAACRAE